MDLGITIIKTKTNNLQPLDLVVAFFKKVTRLADYTSQLDQADCSPQPLAEGGYSEVYQATLSNNTRLAVKCVRPSHITGDSKAVKVSDWLLLPGLEISNIA